DPSEESRYAVEWGIGTVIRGDDHLLIVTVVANEAKVDPTIPNLADRTTRLHSQQENQGLAYILVRQVISLLQRTRLNVTVSCQASAYNEPTMLIIGSRVLAKSRGDILLGSTSHYLIQVSVSICSEVTTLTLCLVLLAVLCSSHGFPSQGTGTRVSERAKHPGWPMIATKPISGVQEVRMSQASAASVPVLNVSEPDCNF
ncbi:hypothetical protein M405DRAFT_819230, partial [Rhizopogon salebrosus TDB-379]